MPIINASAGDLIDENTLLRWVTDELIANHRFTARHGDVNDSSVWDAADTQRWLDRPASETFYGATAGSDMTIGIRNSDDVRGQDGQPIDIAIQVAHDLFTTFDPGSGDRWSDATWRQDSGVQEAVQPAQGDTPTAAIGAPVGVDLLAGGSYIQARIITSPDSASATPNEPLYFYVVVELSIGKFRKFGWGEVCKYYPWDGGLFAMGDVWGVTSSNFYNTTRALFGSNHSNTSAPPQNNVDGAHAYIYAPGWTGKLDTDVNEGRGWTTTYSIANPGGSDQQRAWPALGWDARNGLNFMSQSPSGFSLQSERNPAVIFGGNQRLHDGIDFEIHPMGTFPDIFQAVISDVDAYGVFQDSAGDKFMVVPHINKLTSEFTNGQNSGRHGILIKNPDLVVTI